MSQSLRNSEWTLLAILAIIMAGLIAISKINAARASIAIGEIEERQVQILVTIDGAVKKAGQYSVAEGTPVSAALKRARPTPWADLKAMPLKELIMAPAHLTVPELKEIRVSVSGAVSEPADLVLPVGSRIADLKSKIGFTEETDKTYFRRRRLLRDREKIVVPKKKA
ncbi:MAG: SLBB domain-containing protein [Parachlamydiales bacterium]|nr:SLBB domain-containing protein [Parachlamydiales bacterium]